ncbi:glycoside hydrolase family 57 [Caldithrix abyssi DSM 13497]|uniref:Alpha-amylase n=1 Tax=Caldithrix abyssi DSM 13497 TaxID=880073 RepID=H1XYW1_CALAY|nr:alpha-amylase/4-alpha-glucanotransferase domain-containing protein [Caldithrix abyssi]APF17982.1 alpha-amylase [Caldithrix abyssi DSM 13497]EHO42032.1 glycoside hydrolase family 57 [Caldithrix abyssi DSM 13497]
MKKIKFAFGIHNHQPIGNFDFVFEEAYQKSYLPFLQILKKHPSIKISIHFTGILIDWLEEHHPELLSMVKEMVERGQLEVMSGAYYEPIISVIPESDRTGQIRKLSARVEELFGYRPAGMWLAERVWEPNLPTSLSAAGMKYTILDDTHFKYAGLEDRDLEGYFLTEDLGNTVALFPINKHLRYTIPFQDPQETIEVLKSAANEQGSSLLVFADDGEKFGVWPNTYRHVYEEGWLENFFKALEENSDWIEMVHFSEALEILPPQGKIYLPTASYAEMMHWALFPPTFRKYEDFEHILADKNLLEPYGIFVRGGFWRNFMSKYPEVNVMHKKMLRISQMVHQQNFESADKEKNRALDHLWAAQCNCPYWHGVFGGLYLSHLRFAIFNNLIEAEKILDRRRDLPLIEHVDFDADGHEEILVETAVHDAYFKPDQGAMLFEYDFKPAGKNLLDTMTRRVEGYHNKLKEAVYVEDFENDGSQTASIHDLVLSKERDLYKKLKYDVYERRSLIDHILPADCTLEQFENGEYRETGDFYNQPYRLINQTRQKDRIELQFKRDGLVQGKPVSLLKMVSIDTQTAELEITYRLANNSTEPLSFLFAVEFNYGLQAGQADDRYYYNEQGKLEHFYLNSSGVLSGARMIGLKDEYLRIDIRLTSEQAQEIWRTPVETISLSEGGFERVYQSSAVLMVYKVDLQKQFECVIRQKVEWME